ncbi:hypothetical protein O7630_06725 [Micromonospora sp. WMMD718]|uniref:hypothetical protein n=1 Tax=Micromonospora sp. WMMD718 TaxID=3016098 RepID=UPI00128B2EDA|nr:hypothetical protein [Micromonospora sp. WMMD718]MDG4750625.1 hypothetical protein [Micromonospora sp. WMMD718]
MTFQLSGSYDDTATTGNIAVLISLRGIDNTATFEYAPNGTATGQVKATGECFLAELELSTSVGGKVGWSATFQVDGVVTLGVY